MFSEYIEFVRQGKGNFPGNEQDSGGNSCSHYSEMNDGCSYNIASSCPQCETEHNHSPGACFAVSWTEQQGESKTSLGYTYLERQKEKENPMLNLSYKQTITKKYKMDISAFLFSQ